MVSKPIIMEKRIKVLLVGSELKSLRLYKQESEKLSGHFAYHLNKTIPLDYLEEVPDVIFLNCNRDSLFGLTVLRKVKKIKPGVFVVIVVSASDIKIGRHALNRGAFSYVIKGDQELQQIRRVMHLIETLKEKESNLKPMIIKRSDVMQNIQQRIFSLKFLFNHF